MDETIVSETQNAEKPVDIAGEMAAELERLTGKKQDDEGAETAKDEEEVSESSEESEEDESEEDESEQAEKEPEQEIKKKPSRYERIRARAQAQIEEANQRAEAVARERDEAVKFANLWSLRAKANEQRLQEFIQNAQQYGVQYSPLEQENYQLRMLQQERMLEEQYQQSLETQRLESQVQQRVQSMVGDFTNQALDLSVKFTGREDRSFAKKLLVSYAAAAKADPDVTLEQTAKLISNLSAQKAQKDQIDANRAAPQVRTKQARGLVPQFKTIDEEMMYFLDSRLKGK